MIPTKASDDQLQSYVANIVAMWRALTPDQQARARLWYTVAHDLATYIGCGDVRKGAGILAAFSPKETWSHNIRLATDAASGNVHGHTEAVLTRVREILNGADPADVLPMDFKTGHFYRLILDPADPDPVVIDRHAHDVAAGEAYGDRNRGLSNKSRYATLALAYRLAARNLGELPSVVQSGSYISRTDGRQ